MFIGVFWKNNGAVQKEGISQKRLQICAQHWANYIRCALEDHKEDVIVVQFENPFQQLKLVLGEICEHVKMRFSEHMLPRPQHKIQFGPCFPDQWCPLKSKRALHHTERATPEELKIVSVRHGLLVKEQSYEVSLYSK